MRDRKILQKIVINLEFRVQCKDSDGERITEELSQSGICGNKIIFKRYNTVCSSIEYITIML